MFYCHNPLTNEISSHTCNHVSVHSPCSAPFRSQHLGLGTATTQSTYTTPSSHVTETLYESQYPMLSPTAFTPSSYGMTQSHQYPESRQSHQGAIATSTWVPTSHHLPLQGRVHAQQQPHQQQLLQDQQHYSHHQHYQVRLINSY